MDNTKILEKVDIFRGLSPHQLESLAQISEERKYRGGEAVFTERSSGAEVYILCRGIFYPLHLDSTFCDQCGNCSQRSQHRSCQDCCRSHRNPYCQWDVYQGTPLMY